MSQNSPLDREVHQVGDEISAHFYESFELEPANTARQLDDVLALRYQVYCLDRPFEDPSCFPDKRERDRYDGRSVHALVRHRHTGEAIATVRLVLSRPELGQGRFPMEVPCISAFDSKARHALLSVPRDKVAELSRFAISRDFRRRLGELDSPSGASDRINYEDPELAGKRAMPYITLGLFANIVRLSVENGVTHWMAVMEPALLRLLRRFGIVFTHVGELVDYHGRRKPVLADMAVLLAGIRRDRPDVWAFITDSGRYVSSAPARQEAKQEPRRDATSSLSRFPGVHSR